MVLEQQKNNSKELIVIRSLADSDLGIFAAHRASATSKQRAVNINAVIAKRMISPEIFETGDVSLDCFVSFSGQIIHESRSFKKVHKNWRLGGKKIEGDEFAKIDAKDFILIRSIENNNGVYPVAITFIGKKTDQVIHAGIVAILEKKISNSMACFTEEEDEFSSIAQYCPSPDEMANVTGVLSQNSSKVEFPPMPHTDTKSSRPLTMKEKINQPHILRQMLQVSCDLSAQAQHHFMSTVVEIAFILRELLLATNRIIKIEKNHSRLWKSVAGQKIGFVDGGLANLSMFGSVPIAARTGGYTVVPGDLSDDREQFEQLRCLIDELYTSSKGGIFNDCFPDVGALRDAARISIEAAGAVKLVAGHSDLKWLMLHGSLVSPVSRYTDIIQDGKIRHKFPNFSKKAIEVLLPTDEEKLRTGSECNFINTYLRQLEILYESDASICGVVERAGSTSTVCKSLIDSFDNSEIKHLLPQPPDEWKKEIKKLIDPSEDDEFEGQRITDSLLFRCILEPGEAIKPVKIERNLLRKAPKAWINIISQYPKPLVSYLQVTGWGMPVRIEMFDKEILKFDEISDLIMHCCMLLPKYAFPVGLDIVDKYAKIPNWMSRPVNTFTAVKALKTALDSGDSKLFDSLRQVLCGTGREWLLRPGIYK